MAIQPESIEEWCYLVPHLFSEEGWQTILKNPSSTMSYCSSPWGGTLMKFVLENLLVLDPPDDPATLLTRPETRAWSWRSQPDLSGEACEELCKVEPGTCMLRWQADWRMLQLCDVLFGMLDPKAAAQNGSFRQQLLLKEVLRRNFPETGDSCLVQHDLNNALDGIVLCRPQGAEGRYAMYLVFGVTSGIHQTEWAASHLRMMLDVVRSTANWYLNRQGLTVERQRDQTLYVVLSITSFRRGWPLIPTDAAAVDSVTIDDGEQYGLASWARYHPATAGQSHFYLSDYLRAFFNCMGDSVSVYQCLDGQQLLPYQCVMEHEQWCQVRVRFEEAYMLHKKAYRRANGGTTAPKVVDNVEPRFCKEINLASLRQREKSAQASQTMTVRNTFLEMDEGCELQGKACRRYTRHRTAPICCGCPTAYDTMTA